LEEAGGGSWRWEVRSGRRWEVEGGKREVRSWAMAGAEVEVGVHALPSPRHLPASRLGRRPRALQHTRHPSQQRAAADAHEDAVGPAALLRAVKTPTSGREHNGGGRQRNAAEGGGRLWDPCPVERWLGDKNACSASSDALRHARPRQRRALLPYVHSTEPAVGSVPWVQPRGWCGITRRRLGALCVCRPSQGRLRGARQRRRRGAVLPQQLEPDGA